VEAVAQPLLEQHPGNLPARSGAPPTPARRA
jgi:hypothetical protein